MLQNTLPSNTTATTFSTTQYTQNSLFSQNSNNNMMDESGSGFRTQEGPPTSYTSHNNTNDMNGDTSGGIRGVSEDLAWLLLYEISTALKYMHDRGKILNFCAFGCVLKILHFVYSARELSRHTPCTCVLTILLFSSHRNGAPGSAASECVPDLCFFVPHHGFPGSPETCLLQSS